LTVAASNEFDEPKTHISADGENWWGSNFGPEADIAAPGVHNYTTDISGSEGYNSGGTLDGDYVSNFNGTSSATPIVAGVSALVLSANLNLREAQVRRILKQTADKVGQVVYTNGRNDKMGHGRVNALKAVQAALTTV
jgi:subtilisin family serine protease